VRKSFRCEQNAIAADCNNNPKRFWKFIKNSSKSTTSVNNLKWVDNNGLPRLADCAADKADSLQEFFSSVYTIEDNSNFKPIEVPVARVMSSFQISKQEILDKLSSLKVARSPGPDLIHPRVLYEAREAIVYPLWMIFNCSVTTGSVPDDWRLAEVIALFKKGSRSDRGNYRPVSLTSICCKILEACIKDHIMKHLICNGLLSDKQYGFAKGRSSMLQLLHMLDKWTGCLEFGGQIDVIYTDFEKAFDKVPHRRLISKLQAYRIHPGVVSWIEAFLSDRKQRVRVEGEHSNWRTVTSGIPQGSVLGPVLFVLYINDLPKFCGNDSDIYLFADDAKLWRHILSPSDNLYLQASLDAIKAWSDEWLLKLNYGKCRVVSYGLNTDTDYNYSITDSQRAYQLVRGDQINDLGVILDSRLAYSSHIQNKIAKCYGMIGLIKRNFRHISLTGFVLLYKCIVRSHLDYCHSVWAPYLKSDVARLEKVQRRATKCIPGLGALPYIERLKKCGLTTLKFRRIRGDMIETFKILSGIYDRAVVPIFPLCLRGSTRGNQLKINTMRTRYDIRKFSFKNRVVKIWNGLPDSVVLSDSVNIFKNRLDKFWGEQEVVLDWEAEISGAGDWRAGP